MAKTESSETKDMLMALGGVALVVFGAGLIMSHPFVRRYLGSSGLGGMVSAAIPDLERYLKLRSM
ncbi:MAG TPA: hypothetical protein VGL72_18945 [Bryobacteraceae bacterium]